MKYTPRNPVVPLQRIQRPPDGLGVRLPHELADELLLTPQRPMCLDRARTDNGVAQPIVQPNAVELLVSEFDKLFAEFLQGVKGFFLGGFAGL